MTLKYLGDYCSWKIDPFALHDSHYSANLEPETLKPVSQPNQLLYLRHLLFSLIHKHVSSRQRPPYLLAINYLHLQYNHNRKGMSLEHDIQSRFRSEHHKIMVNLIYTYNWTMEKSKRFFEKADLTPQQFNILRILRGAGKPLSTMQIRQRMLDRMSDTSRIVDRLLKKELVQKMVCKDDRRLVDITITEKGMKLLQELDNYNDEMDALLSSINEEEAKTLNHLLDKLRGSV